MRSKDIHAPVGVRYPHPIRSKSYITSESRFPTPLHPHDEEYSTPRRIRRLSAPSEAEVSRRSDAIPRPHPMRSEKIISCFQSISTPTGPPIEQKVSTSSRVPTLHPRSERYLDTPIDPSALIPTNKSIDSESVPEPPHPRAKKRSISTSGSVHVPPPSKRKYLDSQVEPDAPQPRTKQRVFRPPIIPRLNPDDRRYLDLDLSHALSPYEQRDLDALIIRRPSPHDGAKEFSLQSTRPLLCTYKLRTSSGAVHLLRCSMSIRSDNYFSDIFQEPDRPSSTVSQPT